MRALKKKYSPEVLAVTDGSRGGYYLEGGAVEKYESIKVNAVDTNGAGDTFHGAFLAWYTDGFSVGECCERASAVAAFKCMSAGVRDSLPDREQAEIFLRKERESC